MSLQYMPVNLALSVTADKEDAAFPAGHVLTDHPRQVWRSTDQSGALAVDADQFCSGVFLAGIKADSVVIRVTDDTGSVLVGDMTYDLIGIDNLLDFMTGSSELGPLTSLWCDFGRTVTGQSTITIEFVRSNTDGLPVECGLVWPGSIQRFTRNIQTGFDDSYRDYSDINQQQYNNGAAYIYQRETARRVVCRTTPEPREALDIHYQRLRRLVGPRPVPVRLVTCMSGRWAFFARMESEPKRTIINSRHACIEFTLIERL